MTDPIASVREVLQDLAQIRATIAPFPHCLVGSAVVAAYLKEEAIATGDLNKAASYDNDMFSDIDIFTSREGYFMLMGALMNIGYTKVPKYERTASRHLAKGFGTWHTNSLKLANRSGIEVNVIVKYDDRDELDTLAKVLLSFDWGGLCMGYDEFGIFRDWRSAIFTGQQPDLRHGATGFITSAGGLNVQVANGDYGMLPAREASIGQGYMGEYVAARMFGRLAKMAKRYGSKTISTFANQLVNGYEVLSRHYFTLQDQKHQALASFYQSVIADIKQEKWDELAQASKAIIEIDDTDAAAFAAELSKLV